MLLEIFVNELSLTPAAADVETGQARADEFLFTIRAATARGVLRSVRIPEDFFNTPLAADYTWFTWLSDTRVERELRQYFRSLATKTPFLNDEPNLEVAWADIDCFWHRQQALGLKAAYVGDGLALSLASRPEWDSSSIECEIQEIRDGDVWCRNEAIHHASSARHVDSQMNWIQQRIRFTVRMAENFGIGCSTSFRHCVAAQQSNDKWQVSRFSPWEAS